MFFACFSEVVHWPKCFSCQCFYVNGDGIPRRPDNGDVHRFLVPKRKVCICAEPMQHRKDVKFPSKICVVASHLSSLFKKNTIAKNKNPARGRGGSSFAIFQQDSESLPKEPAKQHRRIGILRLRLSGLQTVFIIGKGEDGLCASGLLFEDVLHLPRTRGIAHCRNDGFNRHRPSAKNLTNFVVNLRAE